MVKRKSKRAQDSIPQLLEKAKTPSDLIDLQNQLWMLDTYYSMQLQEIALDGGNPNSPKRNKIIKAFAAESKKVKTALRVVALRLQRLRGPPKPKPLPVIRRPKRLRR